MSDKLRYHDIVCIDDDSHLRNQILRTFKDPAVYPDLLALKNGLESGIRARVAYISDGHLPREPGKHIEPLAPEVIRTIHPYNTNEAAFIVMSLGVDYFNDPLRNRFISEFGVTLIDKSGAYLEDLKKAVMTYESFRV